MKKPRKLSATVLLTFALSMSVVAGETQTPPCASTNPGQIETPPCSAALSEPTAASTASAGMGTLAKDKASFINLAADVLLNFLPLF